MVRKSHPQDTTIDSWPSFFFLCLFYLTSGWSVWARITIMEADNIYVTKWWFTSLSMLPEGAFCPPLTPQQTISIYCNLLLFFFLLITSFFCTLQFSCCCKCDINEETNWCYLQEIATLRAIHKMQSSIQSNKFARIEYAPRFYLFKSFF